jgi:hypothetical protein
MIKKILIVVIPLIMAVLGNYLLSIYSQLSKDYVLSPTVLCAVMATSLIIWLKAVKLNSGNWQSLLLMILFGLVSPIGGGILTGVLAGLIYGIGGAVYGISWALLIIAQEWFIAFPIGILTGAIMFFISRDNAESTLLSK